jgi:hypothetical protein
MSRQVKLIALLAVAAVAVLLASAVAEVTESSVVTSVTGNTVIRRAKTWHPHSDERIPYSQDTTYNGYRTDCSGYASMALRLPKPGPNTVNLASTAYSRPIPMSKLLTGDLVIDSTGTHTQRHAVIFARWANSDHTRYWEYEQRGGYGTDYRTRSYGLSDGSQFHAYRPLNLG